MNLISYSINTEPTYLGDSVFATESSKYVTEFRGKIRALNENDKDELIGEFDITSVDVFSAVANNDECLLDVIDTTQNTFDAADATLDDSYETKKIIETQFGSDVYGSYAVVNFIEIKHEWENSNVDIAMMFDFMNRHLTQSSLLMIEPENKKQEQKLKKFKFKKIKGSKFYAFGNAYKQPEVEL
jgi:hypothetical protein